MDFEDYMEQEDLDNPNIFRISCLGFSCDDSGEFEEEDIEYDEDGMRCEEPAFSVVNFSIKEREVK